jgi:inward rectifier potassium channel
MADSKAPLPPDASPDEPPLLASAGSDALRALDTRLRVVRRGHRHGPFHDAYARLLRARWSTLILLLAGAYLATNTVFATLYLLVGDAIQSARPGSFLDAFSFSVQTLATIGYGAMSPRGIAGNAIVAAESFLGLFGLALTTGLVFSKFARPRGGFLFSRRAVVAPRNGVPCLMLRVANARGSEIADASIRVNALINEVSAEGERMGRFHDLHLQRSTSPVLLLSWLVIHEIDERSPLFGLSASDLRSRRIQIFTSVTGIDGAYGQTVYAFQIYAPDDVLFGVRFTDVVRELPDGRREIDLRKLHDVEALP